MDAAGQRAIPSTGRPCIVNGIVDLGAYESQSRFAMVLPPVFKNTQP